MMVVDIKNIVTRLPELRFTTPVNWRIDEGQQWAVVGPNGAGKTLIADIMQRKFAFKEGEVVFSGDGKVSDFIKSIAFKDIYSLADCRNSYYQQRWHSTETEEMPIVEELLKEYAGSDNLAKILKPAARAMKPERQVGVKLFYRNLSLKRFTANANYLDSSVMPSMRISNRGAEITSDSWK